MSTPPFVEPICFPIEALYRRCGIYVLVGAVSACAILVALPVKDLTESLTIMAVILLLAISLIVYIFRWRLRIDEHGIARRRLWYWDEWPWQAFQDGRIRATRGRLAFRYEWCNGSWWHLPLSIEFIGSPDCNTLDAYCLSLLPEEPSPEPVDVVSLWVPLGRWLRMDATGASISGVGGFVHYRWNDIERLCLICMRHVRPVFCRLEIQFPDRQIHIYRPEGLWDRSEAKATLRFFQRYLEAPRLLIVALQDQPRSLEEVDYRVASINTSWSKLIAARRSFLLVCTFLTLCANAAVLLIGGLARDLRLLLQIWMLGMSGMTWFAHRMQKTVMPKQLDQLETWRDELLSTPLECSRSPAPAETCHR
jgi:hypothetical protein